MYKKFVCFLAVCASSSIFAMHCTDPVNLSEIDSSAVSDIHISANEKGDLVALWDANINKLNAVHVATKRAEGVWTRAETLGAYERPVFDEEINVDAEGKISMSWKTLKEDGEKAYLSQKLLSQDHLTSLYEFNSEDFNFKTLNPYFSSKGEMVFVGTSPFLNSGSGYEGDVHVFRTPDNRIKAPLISLLLPWDTSAPEFVMNDKNGLVVWRNIDDWSETSALEGIWYNNGKLSPMHTICELKGPDCFKDEYFAVSTSINKNNDVVLGWTTRKGSSDRLQVTTFGNGTWSEILTLSSDKEDVNAAFMVLNEKGDCLAVWEATEGPKEKINMAFKPAGQDWVHLKDLKIKHKNTRIADVKADARGDFVVIWESENKAQTHVFGSLFTSQTQTLSEPVLLSPKDQSSVEAHLVLTSYGKGFISWVKEVNDDKEVPQVAELFYDVR